MKKSVWDLSKTLRKLFIKEKGLLSKIVFFCALAASVGGAVYHVICTSCEWFYVKLGGGESSFALLTDFMKAHDLPMRLCGLCWCLFGLLFLISVLTKKTTPPASTNLSFLYP